MSTNLKNQKEEKHALLMRTLTLPRTTRAIILSYIHDANIESFMMLACDAIGVKLVSNIDDLAREGADAFITDVLSEKIPTDFLMKNGVVPIIPAENPFTKSLIEFNPMKFEGNAFLFEKVDQYQIFAALVRYLENIRYPGDKRILLKNISEIKI